MHPKFTPVAEAEAGVPPTETLAHLTPPQGTVGHSFCLLPQTIVPPVAPSGAKVPYRFAQGNWKIIWPPRVGGRLELPCQSSLVKTKEQELAVFISKNKSYSFMTLNIPSYFGPFWSLWKWSWNLFVPPHGRDADIQGWAPSLSFKPHWFPSAESQINNSTGLSQGFSFSM